jgi:hypothetical protein
MMDVRDPSTATDAILLHRLVREVAAARRVGEVRDQLRRTLVAVLAAVYPNEVYRNPASWQRCAPLTSHVLANCETEMRDGAAYAQCAELLDKAGSYFHSRGARPLFERALAIREKVFGPELSDLAALLLAQGDFVEARPLFERALEIREKVLGPKHPDTMTSLNNLPRVLGKSGHTKDAEHLFKRSIAIAEKLLGPEHPFTQSYCIRCARFLLDIGPAVEALSLALQHMKRLQDRTIRGPKAALA